MDDEICFIIKRKIIINNFQNEFHTFDRKIIYKIIFITHDIGLGYGHRTSLCCRPNLPQLEWLCTKNINHTSTLSVF
jgi:hypothetical protein